MFKYFTPVFLTSFFPYQVILQKKKQHLQKYLSKEHELY